MEEVVRRLIKPPAAVPVPIGLEVEGVTTGARVKEVVEGVVRPAASTRELVHRDVRPKPPGIVRGERVPYRKTEGSGGGVPGIHGQGLTRVWVRVRAYSLFPEGVVVAVGGFGDRVLMHKGGVRAGTGSDGPLGGPAGEGAFPGNSLAIGR